MRIFWTAVCTTAVLIVLLAISLLLWDGKCDPCYAGQYSFTPSHRSG